MKKWIALLLVAVPILSGCQIIIVNPFATAPSTEPASETGAPAEPSTEPTEIPTEETATEPTETTPEILLGGGICDTCGLPYADGEGFESLCFDCQEKYGPKCSVCGTDCTYRGTIDGMCDDCWEKSRTAPCAQCGQECVGTWAGAYYVCDTCAQKQPCALCGTPYYIWEMFEGVCFDCEDPSGGMADMEYCITCGTVLYEGGNYDGYCYYCHPDFGFICSKCGWEYPAHKTESGMCPTCEAGEVICSACGKLIPEQEAVDGLCADCYVNQQ